MSLHRLTKEKGRRRRAERQRRWQRDAPLGAGFYSFRNAAQALRIADHDSLPTAAHDAFLLPGCQCTTNGVQGGSNHLRKILAGDGKINFDSFRRSAASLHDQPAERPGDALLDTLDL